MMKKLKTGLFLGLFLLLVITSGVTVHAQGKFESKAGTYYTVSFYAGNGSTDSAYRRLRMKVKANQIVSLPGIPERSGYRNLGWSRRANSTVVEKKEDTNVRIYRNMNFYAVQRKEIPIVFCRNDGSVIKEDYVLGGRRKLPSMRNLEGYTFLGWSTKPNQQLEPEYEAGEIITVKRKTRLYAVMYDRRREANLQASVLPKPDSGKYARVIFVGDSRTVMLRDTLYSECSKSQLKRLAFICQSGQGISWFKKVGEKELLSEINKAKREYPGKKIAIVFNLGVNDLRHWMGKEPDPKKIANIYLSYMNELGNKLGKKGCSLFYMSVNPVNGSMSTTPGLRKEEEIRYFNDCISKGLNSNFYYLNMYDWLMRCGFSTERYFTPQAGDDGVHYTAKTYKRIYRCCINKLNRM